MRVLLVRCLVLFTQAQTTASSDPATWGVSSDAIRRAGLTALVIDLLALASLWRSRAHSVKAKLVWTVIVAAFPVVGAIAWFLLGRERRRRTGGT